MPAPKDLTKPKKARADNQAEPTFFKCAYCEYSCDKVGWGRDGGDWGKAVGR